MDWTIQFKGVWKCWNINRNRFFGLFERVFLDGASGRIGWVMEFQSAENHNFYIVVFCCSAADFCVLSTFSIVFPLLVFLVDFLFVNFLFFYYLFVDYIIMNRRIFFETKKFERDARRCWVYKETKFGYRILDLWSFLNHLMTKVICK